MAHYSLTDPLRDGWLSWPCWLTDSGRLNCKVVTHPASCLAQDKENSPAETSVLTTVLRRLERRNVKRHRRKLYRRNQHSVCFNGQFPGPLRQAGASKSNKNVSVLKQELTKMAAVSTGTPRRAELRSDLQYYHAKC